MTRAHYQLPLLVFAGCKLSVEVKAPQLLYSTTSNIIMDVNTKKAQSVLHSLRAIHLT